MSSSSESVDSDSSSSSISIPNISKLQPYDLEPTIDRFDKHRLPLEMPLNNDVTIDSANHGSWSAAIFNNQN